MSDVPRDAASGGDDAAVDAAVDWVAAALRQSEPHAPARVVDRAIKRVRFEAFALGVVKELGGAWVGALGAIAEALGSPDEETPPTPAGDRGI